MPSDSAVRLGSQVPRVELVPDLTWTQADDAAFLASGYGLAPDPWQERVLSAWLSETKSGRWAAPRCGLAVPRQNGKNAVLEVRELYGMVVLGEKFLHTAHEVKTARKAFLRISGFFERPDLWPELAAMVQTIRKTNGQEAVILKNGGSVEFVARSKGSGRGFTVDVLVLDEAQDLNDEQLEALLPTISAAPLGNPQRILTGTPPIPGTAADVFTRYRDDALAGVGRLSWHEWSIDEDIEPDLDDQDLWFATNPGLGNRLNVSVVQDERADMSDDGFARERLGSWKRAGLASVIDPGRWVACRDDESQAGDAVAFAVDVTPDRDRASIAVCGHRSDGRLHVEVTDNHSGTAWVESRMLELAQRWRPVAIVIDAAGPAASVAQPLKDAGFDVTEVSMRQIAAGCGGFYDDVIEDKLRHLGQPPLDAAVAAARKRPYGDGAWGWSRKDLSDISPLVAATLARLGLVSFSAPQMAEPDVILL